MSEKNYLQLGEVLNHKDEFPLFISLHDAAFNGKTNRQWLASIPDSVLNQSLEDGDHDLMLTTHLMDQLILKRQMPIKPRRIEKLLPRLKATILLETLKRKDWVRVEWSNCWSFDSTAQIEMNPEARQAIDDYCKRKSPSQIE